MAKEKKEKRRIKSIIDSTIVHGELVVKAGAPLLVTQEIADELLATGYFILDELEGE